MKSISYIFLLLISVFLSDIVHAQSYDQTLYEAISWRNVGPFRGGRSCAVTGVPGKPNLFYFGATGGGIWKTKDGGRSWQNISDGYFGGSIGSISVSESDANVIYVGGGEKTIRGNVSFGYGVWKSEDAGKTWKSKGLDKSRHISRIRIHPSNPDIVYAAVMGNLFAPNPERGIYKSVDGGDSWNQVLFVSDEAGAVDLILDPNNPRIMYASTWKASRSPYDMSSGGEGSAIWKSTDSGETWENISSNKGLPGGTWGISGITVSPQNSERIWAIIENEKGGVYRSEDGGKTWKLTNSSRSLRQRAWYYTRIYADTEDEDVVYVVNVSYHKSKDGGKTFSSYRAPHGDHHDLWIAPENADRMIIGDDGGAQVTYDGGDTWSTYHNQPTSQFYRVTTDNHFPYRIYAAQQDNSTIRIAHRTSGRSITEEDWERTAGGESAHIAVDPNDNDVVYGGSYDGFLTRVNHKTGEIQAINVWPDNPMGHGAEGMKYRFQWNFPIIFSKHDPNKLYTFSNHVHLSTNQGQSWELISDDLTRNDSTKLVSSGGPITKDNTSVEYYCTLFAADESPLTAGLMWVGSDDGLVHLTRDGGATWENVTPSNMPEWMMINTIEASPFDEGTCYIAGTKYKAGDFNPYLYKTTDFGKSWTKITDGIENEHFTRALRADPKRKGLLYSGTETGMYVSFDDGGSWQSFQMNLPIVPITDLTIKNNNLIASTQGRGLWIIDDLTVLHQLNDEIAEKSFHLFKPMPSYRIGGSQNLNNKNAGTNHPGGTMFYYYLKEIGEKDTISLSIKDSQGNEIKSFSNQDDKNKIEPKQGSNRFVWNMLYPNAKGFDGMVLWWGSLTGPKALPGIYTVELSINGVLESQVFEIIKDPRSSTNDEGLENQFNFIKEVNEKVTEAHEVINKIRDIKAQLSNYKKYLKDDAEIVSAAKNLDSLLTTVEKELYQTKNRSGQDPLNFPIRLTNKLAHLNSLSRMGDFPPTQQSIAVKDELVGLIDEQLDRFEEIKTNDIAAFNELIKAKSINAIIIKEVED